MRLSATLTRCLLAATVVVLAAAPSAAAVEPIPLPKDDPFYTQPGGLAGVPNGAVLNSRQISASAFSLPLPADAWQVKFKTTGSQGEATAAITTVLVPKTPWLGPGPRPLLSYQTAEDSVGLRCAPSYALRAGLNAGLTNSNLETTLIGLSLLRGWAVSVPDYEGLRSKFLAKGQGRHALDSIRAALRFGPAKIDKSAKIGMWGYSGGALATSQAANIQAGYAPELKLAGIALGGIPADIRATMDSFDGLFTGAIFLGIIGLDRAYPQHELTRYANAKGKAAIAAEQESCMTDVAGMYPLTRIADFMTDPKVFDRPEIAGLMRSNSPLGVPGTPTAPVYGYHSVFDELAPIGPARELYDRYCADGVKVLRHEDYLSEHIVLVATGAPSAMQYLGDRFAGRTAPNSC